MLKRFSKIRTKQGIEQVDRLFFTHNNGDVIDLEEAHLNSFIRVNGSSVTTFTGSTYEASEVRELVQ